VILYHFSAFDHRIESAMRSPIIPAFEVVLGGFPIFIAPKVAGSPP